MRKITLREKLHPCWWIGNIDNPEPPKWFKPELLEDSRRSKWLRRNPFHNLTWYILGIADQPFRRIGIIRDGVFNQVGRWNVCMIFRQRFSAGLLVLLALALSDIPDNAKRLVAIFTVLWGFLPFVSYRGKRLLFYIGWRERGNLGFKIRIEKKGE